MTLIGLNSLGDAIEHLRKAVGEVNEAFRTGRARGRVEALQEIRDTLYSDYVALLEKTLRPDEAFELWKVCLEAFEHHCRRSYLFRLGLKSLRRWWKHVEDERPKANYGTAELMKRMVDSVGSARRGLIAAKWRDQTLLEEMGNAEKELLDGWERYCSRIQEST